ncbi:receptor-transporting protein 3-like [Gracilinanus agilis]|uniref:receptor-transporting protein 3-like n=1 Tax=Gracilinanus agilis TaxID=191870 RepID=UPI001CFE841F|nr:receptor-transporting protein 3-like [Gracilinanus agilis]
MIKNMDIWEQTFQQLIRKEKPQHRWILEVDRNLKINRSGHGWRQYRHHGFARFRCSLCGRRWISAQAVILFRMRLQEPYGEVKMRLFAQRCQRCQMALFEEPEFSEEGVQRVLRSLVRRILLRCYRENVPQEWDLEATREDPLREAFLNGPHDRENCEACLLGVFCPRQASSTDSKSQPAASSVWCYPCPALTRASNDSTSVPQAPLKKRKLILLVSLSAVIIPLIVLMVVLWATGVL